MRPLSVQPRSMWREKLEGEYKCATDICFAAVHMPKVNRVRSYGHVLRRDDGHVLRKALEFEVRGKRKRGRPKKTWKMQVEKESKSVGLEKKDAMNRARWRVGVREIAAGVNPATPVYGDKPGLMMMMMIEARDRIKLFHFLVILVTTHLSRL